MAPNFANYDPTLISIFEVLGSYYVDVFYNHIYNNAKLRKSTRSLTDEYKHQVQVYISAVRDNAQLYRSMVVNLHAYFKNTTSYSTISFNSFVDRIIDQFIPKEYIEQYSTNDKDEVLNSILNDLVAGLGTYTVSPEILTRIIDNHNGGAPVTVRMMQDHSTDLLLTKRDIIYKKLLGDATQAKEVVSIELVAGLHETIRRLAKDKAHLLAKVNKLKAELDDALDELDELEAKSRKKGGHSKKNKSKASKRRSKESSESESDSESESESEDDRRHKKEKRKGKDKHSKKDKHKEKHGDKARRDDNVHYMPDEMFPTEELEVIDYGMIDKEANRKKREELARNMAPDSDYEEDDDEE